MKPPRTIGFPRMRNEAGEKRVFLPEFIQFLSNLGLKVFIEEGYGSRSGYTYEDYKRANLNIQMCSRQEAFQKDISVLLRSPKPEEFDLVQSGCTLISMLHYPTRPNRVARLVERNIKSISLDSIINDNGIRLVENMKAVAWNGLEAAFDWFEKEWPGLIRPDQQPIKVLILGTSAASFPSTIASNRSSIAAALRISRQFLLEETTAVLTFLERSRRIRRMVES